MEKSLTWKDTREIAVIINEKYPQTDVLSLSDKKLMEIIGSIESLITMPDIPEDKKEDYLFVIKCALSRVIEGDEDYNTHQGDAWV